MLRDVLSRGISKLYIRHFAWANGRVVGVQGVLGFVGWSGATPRAASPPPPRGIDTSFELVAMETANGAGRRRSLARDSDDARRSRTANHDRGPADRCLTCCLATNISSTKQQYEANRNFDS
ncbi:hypothetical protein KGM_206110 [Danaus plexippus plexippus]|uniref:Uncharacterized protein n=1 Tax=Danaus plexippus plexippus TaxID=278856 RepID=A0A212EJK0_DANPL|nr:hypothetical protein KGM_206110 [Danaus plexippus plexippus]